MDAENSAAGYRLLLEVNNAIISNLSRESLFRAIAEALRKAVPFDRAVLYDAENDVLRTFALEGPELPGHSHDLHRDISRQGTAAGWVLEHRQSRLRRNIEIEPRVPADEIMVAGGVRAYVCVPLMARGRAIGALLLQSFAPDRYAPEDVPLLEEVAKQIALAVENMRAFEEIARLRARLEEENRYLQEEIKSDHNFEEIVGQSRAIKEVFKAIEAVAPAGATVLISGETGTGKELVARALHNLSPRRGKALIKVNCAALPAGLIESELFGHEKGPSRAPSHARSADSSWPMGGLCSWTRLATCRSSSSPSSSGFSRKASSKGSERPARPLSTFVWSRRPTAILR